MRVCQSFDTPSTFVICFFHIFFASFFYSFGFMQSALKKDLVNLTLPIFIETLLIMSLVAIDTFMLSHVSDECVAAVGLANQLITFCFIVFEVINLGTSVLCSQYVGAGKHDKLEVVVGVSLTMNLLLGLLVSFLLTAFPTDIMHFAGLDESLVPLGADYMRIVGIFAFVQAVSMTLSAVLRSTDKAYWPMIVVFVVNIFNILGNYTLIFGKFGAPELGAQGAAISTAIARTVAMTALFIIVFRTTIKKFPWYILRRYPWDELNKLLRIGLPAAGESMSYNLSQLVIVLFITKLGIEALAARNYCFNIILYSYIFCIAIAHGGAIVIGHLVGAYRWKGAKIMGWYVMKVGMISTLLLSLVIAIAGKWIMQALTDDPSIISLCTTILWIDVLLEIGRQVNIFATNALQSAGDVNYPFYVAVVCMWIIAVGMAYLFGITLGFGLIGIWWMFCLDENVRGAIFIHRWNSDKWMYKSFVRTPNQE